jgi:hypothetical protein
LAQETVPHLLTKRRQDLVAVRTQTINRLHRLLLDLVPGGARRNLTAKRAAALLDQVAPTGAPRGHPLAAGRRARRRRPPAGAAHHRRRGPHQDRGRPVQDQPSAAACWPISTTGMPSHYDPLIAFPTQLHGE